MIALAVLAALAAPNLSLDVKLEKTAMKVRVVYDPAEVEPNHVAPWRLKVEAPDCGGAGRQDLNGETFTVDMPSPKPCKVSLSATAYFCRADGNACFKEVVKGSSAWPGL